MLYIVKIVLLQDKFPVEKADEYFEKHRAWFKENFDKGNFLMLGPMPDLDHTGMIIAQAETRAELDKILAEDVYHPFGGATYEVNEFKAAMVADNIKDYQG